MSLRRSPLFIAALSSALASVLIATTAFAISGRPLIAPTGAAAGDFFGYAVASAGDVNGDGFADTIVGAIFNDSGGTDAGRAYVYFGGPSADAIPDVTLTGVAAGDNFGWSVASAGDVNGDGFDDVIVGAHFNDTAGSNAGRAYVFFGGTSPDATPDLTLTGAAAGDEFGVSVASAGDVNGDGFADTIVGAPFNDAGGTDAGRAYVYFGGVSPDAVADLTLTGFATTDDFGYSVASAGDVNRDGFSDLLVGAPFSDFGGTNRGRADLYFGGPAADAVADLDLEGGGAGDNFGTSVASAGDMNGDGFADMIFGTPFADQFGTDSGRAEVYFGGPVLDAIVDLTLLGTAVGDEFGLCVASAGDVNGDGFGDVVVGAPFNDAAGTNAGRDYVYLGGLPPDAVTDLTLNGAAAFDQFGFSVASAGDFNGDGFADIIASAALNDAAGASAGRAYVTAVYPYQITSPNGGELLVAGRPATVQWLGHDIADLSLSLDGGFTWTAIASSVGGHLGGLDENTFSFTVPATPTDHARVRISYSGVPITRSSFDESDSDFRIAIAGDPPAAASRLDLALPGAASNDNFGSSVASAGDVNGDGYADIIAGAPLNDAAGSNAGRARVFFGGPSADAVADLTLTGVAAGDEFGNAVAPAGDVNGDGFSDTIVGAHLNDTAGSNAGQAYVYFGGPSADAVADLTLNGVAAGDRFGESVASAGDVNGDGFGDVIVGAPFNDAGAADAGRAYVFLGGPSPDAVADLTLTGTGAGDNFGSAVASAGDMNGDRFADVIAGAPHNDAGGTDAGRALVFYGGPAADTVADFTLTGAAAGDNFGNAVAPVGDVNGDGFGDVVVGAPSNDAAGSNAGRAYVYDGGPLADAVADLTLTGAAAGDNFGSAVAQAGDVNADGFGDVIVGAPANDAGGNNAGRAYVYYGNVSADAIADLTLTGIAASDAFGTAVASAGDVNGDGFADVIAGAPFNDAAGTDAGRASVYDVKRYHVVAPNGGETWNVGAERTISWLGAERADVWLSLDGGRSFDLLESAAGGHEFNAIARRVPEVPTRFAEVKVTPSDARLLGSDLSDSLFTIQSSVSLLSFRASRHSEGGVELSWSSEPAVGPEGISGYRLYRLAPGASGSGARIGGDLITETRYTDEAGLTDATYRLAAVNGLGEELELGRVSAGEAIRGMRVWPSPVAIAGARSFANGPVHIAFSAPVSASGLPAGDLDVAVFDMTGRRVATLVHGPVAPGAGVVSLTWSGRDAGGDVVAPGAYVMRAAAPSVGFAIQRKFLVTR